jgi:hypothetical protein
MPLAKIQVPPPPKTEPILGLVPLKYGEKVLNSAGQKHFIVPKEGGVYYPKKSAANQDYNNTLWDYYSQGVELSVGKYNEVIDKWNDKLANFKLSQDNKRWWQIWKTEPGKSFYETPKSMEHKY